MLLAILLVGVTLSFQSATAAWNLCGTAIVADLKLSEDLTCPADGLIVAADGVRINLNDHTISGSGSGIGITITGRTGVSIVGGTIRNFATGIQLLASAGVSIKASRLQENGDGIDLQAGSRGSTIKDNDFLGNRTRGIMVRSDVSQNTIKGNRLAGNRVGILVFAGVDNLLKENVVTGSGLAGIRINTPATGNWLVENMIASNPIGVEFLVTATGAATGNVLIENTITVNGCGIKGPTAGNTFRKNVVLENVPTC
jgi:parallel beta-helix repeat protein